MSPYTRNGSCNQCGECCKILMALFMIDEVTGYCKFLEKTNGTYICQITDGQFNLDVPEKPPGVTDKEFEYWQNECKPYPDPNNTAHVPPKHTLPTSCGYEIIQV